LQNNILQIIVIAQSDMELSEDFKKPNPCKTVASLFFCHCVNFSFNLGGFFKLKIAPRQIKLGFKLF